MYLLQVILQKYQNVITWRCNWSNLKNTGNSPVTGSASNSPTAGVDFNGSHSHPVSGNTGTQGGTMGQSFSILPPYYALIYIIKT